MKKDKLREMAMPKVNYKSVSIEEADNGFVVSKYDDNGRKQMVCESFENAIMAVKKLMGIKSNEKVDELKEKYK